MHSPLTTSQRCNARALHAAVALGVLALVGALPRPAYAASHSAPAHAAPSTETGRETVLRGEVVENGCFVIGGRRGEPHLSCALTCAHAGENLGVLDDETKTLFVVVQDLTGGPQPNPLLGYLAQRVEVRGSTVERGGISAIVVHQVKSLNPPPAKH